MSFTRRTFLLGLGSGVSVLALAACTEEPPAPVPSPSPSVSGDLPVPASIQRSTWSSDPFSLGARSYLPVGATPQHRADLAEPVLDRVFFAGEATSEDAPGTVAGARSMGTRIAVRAAEAAEPGERIAIVGAGASGAEAARYLSSLGIDVIVLEARDRTGGRIESVTADDRTAELGPWRFAETADADVISALDRVGVSVAPLASTSIALLDDDIVELPENDRGAAAIGTAIGWAAEQRTDTTLADSLEQSGAAATATGSAVGDVPGAEAFESYLAAYTAATGSDVDDLSSWFATVPQPDTTVVATGSLSALVDTALEGVETYLSTAVVGVSYDEDGVSLRLGTGESLGVDRVIITVPIGVLQTDGIQFNPLLPFGHRTAISALGMGAVETVWLEFDEPFWSTDAVMWTLSGTDAPIRTWFNLEAALGRPVLVGVVGGAAADELPEGDDLTQAVIESLAPFAAESD